MLIVSITMPIAPAMSAFWGMTINNYTETDLALLQHAYPDHIRRIVHTLERGEKTGTPHIQAYVRLFRQQRMSYMRKLFPSATDFKCLNSEEWVLNAERYAQKQDSTAESPSVITNNAIPDPVTELVSVMEEAFGREDCNMHTWDRPLCWRHVDMKYLLDWCERVQFDRVVARPHLAKFYVSPMYTKVRDQYGLALKKHICLRAEAENAPEQKTHTHTHTQPRIIFSPGSINNDGDSRSEGDEEESGSSAEASDSEGEDYEDSGSEASEGTDEGGSACSGSSDDCSES